MDTYGKRLKFAMDQAGIDISGMARRLEITYQAVTKIIKGTGAFSAERTMKAAYFLGVDPQWLTTGDGPMNLSPVKNTTPIELDNNPEYPAVRRVSVKASAGATGYAIEAVDDLPPIVFRADWYSTHGYRPERMLALKVAGESMVPSLYPGDLIVINTESVTPKDGVAFLVSYEGEIVVKRLQRDAGAWWLTSDNPDKRFARKVCDSGTQIIGEVVYKQSERI